MRFGEWSVASILTLIMVAKTRITIKYCGLKSVLTMNEVAFTISQIELVQ